MIMAPGGESAIDDGIKKHVVTRLTDEGLILEFYDRPNAELFDSNSEPSLIMQKLVGMVVKHASLVTNPIAIEAHEPPHFYWSMSMFRKRRTENGEQATEAGRDCLEVKAS